MSVKIFISYSQDDFKSEARWLRGYLSKHIPDSDVFIDQLIPKGIKWREEIKKELKASKIVVVILTNSALTSSEVTKEITTAQNLGKTIIPCKDDLLPSDWNGQPHSLGELNGVEFENYQELGRKLVHAIRPKSILDVSMKALKNETNSHLKS
ncbi:MAG: toll/interleukin-1 receptor domain-containing protein [Thaumarchaeota archaeon]|nr:toll/interleukin-1 receptor domain-containing protein [Nitrososphaerota archaeon]